MKPEQTAFIPMNQIIIKGRTESPITTVGQLAKHLQTRSALYTNRLANAAVFIDNPDHGFEERNRPGLNPEEVTADALFTGTGLCDISAFAIYDAVSVLAPSLKTEVILLGNERDRMDPFHFVTKVTDPNNDESLYFDGTYAQFDQNRSGKITYLSTNEIVVYFDSGKIYEEVRTSDRVTTLSAWKSMINEKRYNSIVASLL